MRINPGNLMHGFCRLLTRPDFKRNPILAVLKRVWWRVRWKFNDAPWLLTLPNGLRLLAPKSGAGALIYYQGWSEPEVASFLSCFLRPGMNFIDVGAHIGEYVLLAASAIGEDGKVYAFEPDPRSYGFLQRNIMINRLRNIYVNNSAVFNVDGTVKFFISEELTTSRIFVSHLTQRRAIDVSAITLDTYVRDNQIDEVHIIKMDIEGAELFALEGAKTLLSLPSQQAPVIVFEYSPSNCKEFGYDATKIFEMLRSFGYKLYVLKGPTGRVVPAVDIEIDPGAHINVVASKRPLLQ